MREQSEAKERQGYVPKAVPHTCVNCKSFTSNVENIATQYGNGTWRRETNMRCLYGGFAVKKMGTCNSFLIKPAPDAQKGEL